MRHFGKIFLLSFLLLQVFSYLHLEEHGHGGEHEHDSSCDFVLSLNNLSIDDISSGEPEILSFEKDYYNVLQSQSQISQLNNPLYQTRAPPQFS